MCFFNRSGKKKNTNQRKKKKINERTLDRDEVEETGDDREF
jgi:hypothetical protein